MDREIIIGTRFCGKKPEDLRIVTDFVYGALDRNVKKTLVAVNADEDKSGILAEFEKRYNREAVEAFPVTPWGKFVQPLNALVLKAAQEGASYLLLASVEVMITPEIVSSLLEEMQDKYVLVAGAAMPGHDFSEDFFMPGTGITVPWNTLAMWRLKYLANIGFPLVWDMPFRPEMAGVEELAAIAVCKAVYPHLKVVLKRVPGIVELDMSGWDADRREAHVKKMQTKKIRSAWQMSFLGLPFPSVHHKGV